MVVMVVVFAGLAGVMEVVAVAVSVMSVVVVVVALAHLHQVETVASLQHCLLSAVRFTFWSLRSPLASGPVVVVYHYATWA